MSMLVHALMLLARLADAVHAAVGEGAWRRGLDVDGLRRSLSARCARAAETLHETQISLAALLCSVAALASAMQAEEMWRRRRGGADLTDEEAAEDESESEEHSSEEKKLAFACLSEAIEDAKSSISEQQYMSLYSAALWCFNLTPHWAEGVPLPPGSSTSTAEPSVAVQPDACSPRSARAAPVAEAAGCTACVGQTSAGAEAGSSAGCGAADGDANVPIASGGTSPHGRYLKQGRQRGVRRRHRAEA